MHQNSMMTEVTGQIIMPEFRSLWRQRDYGNMWRGKWLRWNHMPKLMVSHPSRWNNRGHGRTGQSLRTQDRWLRKSHMLQFTQTLFFSSHTYSTLTCASHAYDTSFSHLLHSDSCLPHLWLIILTLTPLWLVPPTLMTHHSHTYSTDSYLPHLWLIVLTLTPPQLINPYCTFTIYTASYPPVTLAWSYSNIPEF